MNSTQLVSTQQSDIQTYIHFYTLRVRKENGEKLFRRFGVCFSVHAGLTRRIMSEISVKAVEIQYLRKNTSEFNKKSHNAIFYAYSSYS